MMIDVKKNLSGLILASVGLLGACSVQTSDSSLNSMDAFEARKAAKTDDGSVATMLAQPVAPESVAVRKDRPVVNEWMLSVEPIKSTFLLGEPIVVRVRLENVSDEPLEVAPLLQPEFQQTRYTITRLETGGSAPFLPAARYLTLPATHMRTFQPGEYVEEEVRLIASKAGWMFKWPGKYEITVDFDASTSGANLMGTHSAIVTVRAGNEQEQAAGRIMMEGEAPLLLYWEQGDHATDGLARLERIIADYPGTLHAVYAHFALGSNDAQPFFNGKTTREPRLESAIEHLQAVRQALRAPNAPVVPAHMRTATYERLADSLASAGQVGLARTVLDEFLSLYADDPTMADGVAHIRTLRASI